MIWCRLQLTPLSKTAKPIPDLSQEPDQDRPDRPGLDSRIRPRSGNEQAASAPGCDLIDLRFGRKFFSRKKYSSINCG
jgi:hypothetical protein